MMSAIDHTSLSREPLRLERETWRALRTRLIFVYDHVVDMKGSGQGYSRPLNHALWLLREGGVVLRPDTGPLVRARAGQWVALPGGFGRHQQFEENSVLLSVHFAAEWPDGRPLLTYERPILAQRATWSVLEPTLEKLLRITDDLPARSTFTEETGFDDAFRGFLALWHGYLVRAGAVETAPCTPDPRLAAAIAVLDGAAFTGSVPYAQLCSAASLSRVHLDRLFRQQIKKSPRIYLQERVYNRVCESLAGRAGSVKEIAFDAGFATVSHFAQWFRKKSGMTPAQYRESATVS